MSLPVFRGVCRQYVSYLVQLVILLYIYIYIYIYVGLNAVGLNVMVVCLPILLFFVPCGYWLIVCCSFSMKYLHIDPCLCLFYPASPQHYTFSLKFIFD